MPKQQRPKAAVYSIVRGKRDKRAVELLRLFCLVAGADHVVYRDPKIPEEGQPSAWARLLGDVAEGKYDVVIIWQESKAMAEYCARHNTRLEVLDPFAWLQAMRAAKVDMRKIR